MGVSREQTKLLLPAYRTYCDRMQQLGADTAASLAALRELQQVRTWVELAACAASLLMLPSSVGQALASLGFWRSAWAGCKGSSTWLGTSRGSESHAELSSRPHPMCRTSMHRYSSLDLGETNRQAVILWQAAGSCASGVCCSWCMFTLATISFV